MPQSYTLEFKKKIVRLHEEEGRTYKSITAEYGVSKAARPFNSRLDKSKLAANGFTPLPTWQDALHRYLQELNFNTDGEIR